MSIAVKVGKAFEFPDFRRFFSKKKGDGYKLSPFFFVLINVESRKLLQPNSVFLVFSNEKVKIWNFHFSLTCVFVQKITFARLKPDNSP